MNDPQSVQKEEVREIVKTAVRMIGLMNPKSPEEMEAVIIPNIHISIQVIVDRISASVREEARATALQDAMEVVKLHKGANTENNMIGLEAALAVNQELEDILSALMSLAKE